MEWNGMELNANGMELNGMERNGMQMQWNGMEWNAMEWGGIECKWNGMGWYLGELVGREHGVVGRARADVLGAEQVIRERVVRVVRPLLPLELVDRVVHLQWSWSSSVSGHGGA